uniref:uncharacterized protein LOC101297432 isoform X1 n=1 Tax=Fragaria vesca subsp. vesca TaxID=101020 RepID=UPI0005CB2583|nr:PREDICTED: uncharacterized protein LOC101297432 isoform X1 [Fragaria vesca subsp. vesca]
MDEETIVNVGKIKTQSIASQRSTDDPHNDYVVVGKHSKSLTITDSSDVKRVLEELASIDPRKRVLGVEVLWTPQLSSNAMDIVRLIHMINKTRDVQPVNNFPNKLLVHINDVFLNYL